jgi:superfamily II DNA or RNA helicase
MSLPTPRPYQAHGLNLTRKAYAEGHRKILFWLATGGGKSAIFLNLTANLLKSGSPTIIVMRRRQLIFQTKNHFEKCGIKASVIMGNSAGFDPSCNLQICSIDTVIRRDLSFLTRFKACIVDECHDATSESYQNFFTKINVPLYIGLTASPFPVGKKVHDFWTCCVNPIQAFQLRDMGFLVPCDLFIPPEVDLSDIATDSKTGDYKSKPLSEKMSKLEIIGDVVKTYQEKGGGKPALCFGVDKDHSIKLADEFNQNNIPAVHCDESTPQDQRDLAIAKLKSGQIKVLCNVNIFSTGVDIPEAEIGIMARPTKSEILYIQQVGRLLRPYRKCGKCQSGYDNSPACPVCGYDKPDYIKTRAIILDHGGNTGRHGEPYAPRYAALKEEDKETSEKAKKERPLIKTCTSCFYAYSAKLSVCPSCGNEKTRERIVKTADGSLRPYDEFELIKNTLAELDTVQKLKGFKANWKYFKLIEKFGETAMKYQKDFNIPKFVPKVIAQQKQKGIVYN